MNNYDGDYNTASGSMALYYNTAGSFNTAFGAIAGDYAQENNYCTYLGYGADNNSTTSRSNSMALGCLSVISANNQVRIGNSTVNSIGGYESWTDLSDSRFKENLRENIPGLAFITKLRPASIN
jgi:hypothetical protein